MIQARTRRIAGGIVIFVVLVLVTFPLWSPFFRTDAVDEAFPDLTASERDAVRKMPEEQRSELIAMSDQNAVMAMDTARAMLAGDKPMDETMPEMVTPVIVGQGTFSGFDAIHKGEGTATVYELADKRRVLRFENFSVTNGPDLQVILSRARPASILDSVGDDYVDLGQLKGNVGNQNYEIPADVDLNTFRFVIVYCMPFHVNFIVAGLEPPQAEQDSG